MSSSAFWTVQHGCLPNLAHMARNDAASRPSVLLLRSSATPALRYADARRRPRCVPRARSGRHPGACAARGARDRARLRAVRVGRGEDRASPAPGTVLGHEVVALTSEGRRVALIHHAGCGACARCLSGHASTCEQFPEPTIVPGGFAERVRASGWVELPASVDDARGTYVEPLACVLRGAERVPRGRVLVVGNGFIGRLFGAVLERRGDTVFAVDRLPQRAGSGAGRAGRCRRALRSRRRRDGTGRGRAGRDGAALCRRGDAAGGMGCTGAS